MIGCVPESELKSHFPHFVLHGHGAKPWIVESVVVNNEEKAPRIHTQKNVFVFYDDFTIFEQQVSLIGSYKGKKGYYSGSIVPQTNDTLLRLEFKDEQSYLFRVELISNHKLILKRLTSENNGDEVWKLTTVPKPTRAI